MSKWVFEHLLREKALFPTSQVKKAFELTTRSQIVFHAQGLRRSMTVNEFVTIWSLVTDHIGVGGSWAWVLSKDGFWYPCFEITKLMKLKKGRISIQIIPFFTGKK